jgi:hypothetical protein
VDLDELDRLSELITVDCYNDEERVSAFLQVFQDEVALPVDAALVGSTVQVIDFDIREDGREVTAHCRRGAAQQEILLAELHFAPDTTAAWLHAAYRNTLGLKPYPANMPAGWKPDWL